ncbi:DUF4430 domain-containing protein [Companilactobacillus nodensis]|uniref:Transcobalamin-like C-terminal domain-containing protein n=1 Tax=Companilactobacillus nodensis DSM 19682 = JCM 14932 = NBRC 107160 TaxID=1423775 RepID=A0A0R1K588_9LACO|nr:DUF4430 domain-containing protein [Companilactobacillus nodensis]KRK78677.1 hypothetical protein FD03_GL002454 [Companilactobacillus nodensis DSM 19682 = JCM 14932 = NBRC 107160]
MKKRITVLLMSLLLLIGVIAPAATTTADAKTKNIKVTYVLKKNKKQIAKKTVTLKKNATVMTGVKKGWKVTEKGGFISAIDGKKQNNKKKIYWTFTVNGKKVNVAANKKKLKNKDKVTFTLAKYNG